MLSLSLGLALRLPFTMLGEQIRQSLDDLQIAVDPSVKLLRGSPTATRRIPVHGDSLKRYGVAYIGGGPKPTRKLTGSCGGALADVQEVKARRPQRGVMQ
jgi:hypothetical protein